MGKTLTTIGVILYFGLQLIFVISSYQYNNFDLVPVYLQVIMISLFFLSIVFIIIGGFLIIGEQAGAQSSRQYLKAFIQGFWKHGKLAVYISLVLMAIFLVYAAALTILD